MAVNLRSVYLLCRGCLPYLTAAGRSAIVNVASIQGSRGFSGYPGYAATKAGDPNELSENSFAEIWAAFAHQMVSREVRAGRDPRLYSADRCGLCDARHPRQRGQPRPCHDRPRQDQR